jgi:ADP-ribose pyrophosphatase YjhB (NUDIX family)
MTKDGRLEKNWLEIAKRLNALAHNGLLYASNQFDSERYEEIKALGFDILSNIGDMRSPKMKAEAFCEAGYQTPKCVVRALIERDNRILMVQERSDDRWSLPGGWAEVGFSPAEVAVKEVLEETGLLVRATRLLAVYDKRKHEHPPSIYSIYKIFFLCEEIGGDLQCGSDVLGVGFFTLDNLPLLSESRISLNQIKMLTRIAETSAPAAFD